MRQFPILLALLAATSLSGCMQTATERGIAGAVGGALLADNMDENGVAGAAVGALVGVASCGTALLPPCQPSY